MLTQLSLLRSPPPPPAGTAFAAAAGIYPDDHWSYSTKVSTDSHAAHVKQTVDAGKTLFMRLIASEG
jgi:hypothetical protein